MTGLRALIFATLICGTSGLVYGQSQSLTLNAAPNPANPGQTVTMTATLTNLSSSFSLVTFYETINGNDVPLGSTDATGSGTVRTATLTKNNFTAGTHNLKAQSCVQSTVNSCFTGLTTLTVAVRQNSSITLNSSPNPSSFGSPVTLTGTVSPSTATGTVSFFDTGAPLGSGDLSNGVATLVVSAQTTGNFSAGSHLLTATYNGDNNFNQSFAQAVNQVVNPAGGPMTITSISPGSAAAGSAGFTLTINGTGFVSNVTATWNNASLPTSFGSATQVTASVPAGFLASAGTALIRVVSGNNSSNGAPFVVNPPGQSCNFTFSNFSPANLSFGASGGQGSVFVTATRSDCTWSATSNAGFVTFGGSITGSGTLNFNVLSNGGSSSRSAKITVGMQSFSLTQGGTTCLFALPSSSQAFGPGGGNGTAAVQATPGCSWSASGGAPFVTVNAPGGGSGNGSIGFSVAANPSGATRSVTLTIANQPYTVIQAGSGSNVNCTATAAATPLVALEGLTEAAGGININCTGVTSTIKGDVVLTLNTNVTNPTNGTINALLSVNGGAPLSGVVTGYNIIRFPNVSLTPTGNNTVNLAISQVCANANVVGVLSTAPPILGQVTISGLTVVPVTGGQLNMATIAPALAFTKLQANPPAGGPRTLVPLVFQETQPGSFQANAILANATRLRIALSSIPASVRVFAPVFPVEGQSRAQLFSADANGAGGSAQAGSAQPEGTYQELTVTGGNATATWVVLASDANQVETWTFPLLLLNAGTGDLNGILVNSSLAPVSDVNLSSFTAPVPRYRDFSVPQKLVNLRLTTTVSVPNGLAPLKEGAIRDPKAAVNVGSNVTYTHKLTNDTSDQSQGATHVTIRDTLPSGLTLVSCTATGATCTTSGTDTVEVVEDTLPPTQQATVSVVAQVNPSLASGLLLENAVTASSDQVNQDVSAATASVSLITAGTVLTGGPTVGGPSPASGSGLTQNFSFQFSHPAGFQSLSVVNVLINNFLDGRNACYLAYEVGAQKLSLVNDQGQAGGPFAGQVTLGNASTIQNSQCIVGLVSAPGSGNTLTLNLSITFKAAFGGNRIMFSAARDGGSGNSDWQTLGVWQVPFTPTGAIAVTTADTTRDAAPAGSNRSLAFNLSDSKGAGDLGIVNVLINNFIDGRRACYVAYIAASNTLVLVNDGGDAGGPFAGSMTLNGTGNGIENSQCKINAAGTSAAPNGNSFKLTLNVMFKAAFAGNKVMFVAGRDRSDGNNTDWQAAGTVTIQ